VSQRKRRKRNSSQQPSAPLEYREPQAPARPRLWLAVIGLGILIRFAISAASLGTNDAAAWIRFGDEIRKYGLIHTYEIDRDFNHPPIPGYWAATASSVAGGGGSIFNFLLFTNVFRLPAILADCAGMYLLWLIWRKRIGGAGALIVAALFSLSLNAILVSAFHCNTDSLYVALCLLAVYLIEDRCAPFWAGLALGAAINVKIIPVLLVLPLLLSFRRWKDGAKFLAALALWVLPYVPVLIALRQRFFENVVQYNSNLDRWGISFFLLMGQHGQFYQTNHVAEVYYFWAKYLVLGLIVIWSIAAAVLRRWNRYELAAITFAIFLVFTPGFGVQYTALAGLLLFALRPGLAAVYGWVAGIFIGAVYFFWWAHGAADYGIPPRTWPAFCQFQGLFPENAAYIGLIAWAMLLYFMVVTLARPSRGDLWRAPTAPHPTT